MNVDGLLILVVSLESATERKARVSAQLQNADFAFVSAIDGKKDQSMGNRFVTAPVDAIWHSHKKAYKEFLSSNEEFCLILEDDFLITEPDSLIKSLKLLTKFKFDLFQLGWLETGTDIRMLKLIDGFTYFLFRSLNRVSRYMPNLRKALQKKMRPRRTSRYPSTVIPDSFLPGAHGYVISRTFAENVLTLNDPTFLSADDFLIAITKMRSFDVCRSRKNLIGQLGHSMAGTNRFTQK
jgi:GR25 family glycosyltransferase involved in LPS biosynthesis